MSRIKIPCLTAIVLMAVTMMPTRPAPAFDDGSANDDAISALVEVLGASDDAGFHLDILKGINEALKGRRRVDMPKAWPAVYKLLRDSKDAQVRELAQALAIVFGDASAFDALKKTMMDAKADAGERRRSLASLLSAKAADLAPLLQQLIDDKALRADAIKALAAYDDAKTPQVLLAGYKHFSLPEKQAALSTLAARGAYAHRLVAAVKDQSIPRGDVPADTVRQLRLIDDAKLQAAILDLWGKINDTPADTLKRINDLRELLSKPTTYEPDLARGRAIFAQSCQQCHLLFGTGGKVGPDITGSNRNNLDYLLQNVVDPNALIGKDYQATQVQTEDDQIIVGIIEREDESALTLKTTSGSIVIPKNEISTRTLSEGSMMPQGLIDHLKEDELRDFVAYMASPGQTPLLATANNAIGLFNDKDLSNWVGDENIWSVEKGEIVGKAPAGNGNRGQAVLMSQMVAGDFSLKFKVKSTGTLRAGVMLRGQLDDQSHATGLLIQIAGQQAGQLLVTEKVTTTLSATTSETLAKAGDWHTLELRATGGKIELSINGKPHARIDHAQLPKRGHLGFQLWTGATTGQLRIKELELQVIAP